MPNNDANAYLHPRRLRFTSHALACQVVEGDNITGQDLAAANPLFAAMDPNLRISSTPSPGAVQLMRAEQLARLARQNGIVSSTPFSEVCFERATNC